MTATAKIALDMADTGEVVSRTLHLNANWTKIDDAIGATNCTSGTRPSTPYPGQEIYETDTRLSYIRNAANTTWVLTGAPTIPVVASTGAITAPYSDQIIYLAGVGLLKYNGTSWVTFHPYTTWLYKPTTTSRTSTTTLTADPDLQFSVVTNSAYAIEGYIVADGLAAADIQTDFSGPAGASMFTTNFANVGPAGGASLIDYNIVPHALATPRGINTVDTVTPISFPVRGVLVTGAAGGTCSFRWAQVVSNATATRVLGGSWLRSTKIA